LADVGALLFAFPMVHPGPIIAVVGAVLDCIGRFLADLVVEAVGVAREAKEGK